MLYEWPINSINRGIWHPYVAKIIQFSSDLENEKRGGLVGRGPGRVDRGKDSRSSDDDFRVILVVALGARKQPQKEV
jgi:hypothetical protein